MSSHILIEDYLRGDTDADASEVHLEMCDRCRRSLPTPTEVARARMRVMSRLETVASPLSTSRVSGPLVALAAGALVLLMAVPLLLLSRDVPVAETTPVSVPSAVDRVVPLPSDQPASADSFVLTFDVGTDRGWLIWQDARNWSVARIGSDKTLRYRMGVRWTGRDSHGSFFDGGDESLVTEEEWNQWAPESGEYQAGVERYLARDPDIPWRQLVGTESPEAQFIHLVDGNILEAKATNPLTVSAAANEDDVVVEFGDNGRIVVWGEFAATAIEQRPVADIDLGAVLGDITLEYSDFLASRADTEVRPFLDDGLITHAEYRDSAQAAIECAEAAGSSASFTWTETIRPGELTLGSAKSCRDGTFGPVDDMFRFQLLTQGADSVLIAEATMEGDVAQLAMIESSIGERVNLASGTGWDIDIAPRGEGWCIYERSGSSFGEGCVHPDNWLVPNLLTVNLQIGQGVEHFTGVTDDRVATVVGVFVDGTRLSAVTENDSPHSLRGFGFEYEFDDLGIPRTVELFDDNGVVLHIYDLYADVCPPGTESRSCG